MNAQIKSMTAPFHQAVTAGNVWANVIALVQMLIANGVLDPVVIKAQVDALIAASGAPVWAVPFLTFAANTLIDQLLAAAGGKTPAPVL